MHDSFFPFWLAVLLGMWSVAFTLWVRSNVHWEVRLWSGLATLVYLALIFLALRVNSGQEFPLASRSTVSQLIDFSFGVCVAVSLAASLYCSGRVTSQCRRAAYLAHTLANACICAMLERPEIALGLLIVCGLVARPLVRNLSIKGSVREWLILATRFNDKPVVLGGQGDSWLVGLLISFLAFTLFGTVSYTLRSEISYAASSAQHTALPTPDRLNELLVNRNYPDRILSPLDLAMGSRSDILVLMSVIVFLYLAMSMAPDSVVLTDVARTVEITTGNPPE
jgi:hypothetical protein